MAPPTSRRRSSRPPARTRSRPRLLTVRLLIWRTRWALTLVAAGLVGLGVVREVRPPPAPSTSVVVTSRAVAPGTELTESDLRVVPVPSPLAIDGAVGDVAALTGRTAAVGLPRGMPVVDGVLAGPRFDVAAPDGAVILPLPLGDTALAGLLEPGDLLDVVRAEEGHLDEPAHPDGFEVLARRALVLEVVHPQDEAAGTLGLGTAADGRTVVVVAVSPGEGRRLAAGSTRSELGAVLVEGSTRSSGSAPTAPGESS